MKAEAQLLELEKKIIIGLKQAHINMIAMKKRKNTPVVFSRNNKIIEQIPKDYNIGVTSMNILNEDKEEYK